MKFHPGEIAVQTRAGVTADAAEVGEGILDHIPEGVRDFLAPRRMVVIASLDARGRVWASVVTGEPGFLSVLDDRTVASARLRPKAIRCSKTSRSKVMSPFSSRTSSPRGESD